MRDLIVRRTEVAVMDVGVAVTSIAAGNNMVRKSNDRKSFRNEREMVEILERGRS